MVAKLLARPLWLAALIGAVVLCLAGGAAIALSGHAPAPKTPSPALLGDASDAQPAQASPVAPATPDGDTPDATTTVTPSPAAPAGSKVSALSATRAPAGRSTAPAGQPSLSGQSSPSSAATPPLVAASPSATGCAANEQLNDAEINWLLGEVSSTAGTDPQYAAGKATIDAGLQPLLGQNLCANQAQPTVTALCADPSASKLIAAMTAKMPIYVRAYVGNPCSAQLSTVLPKLAPFTAALG